MANENGSMDSLDYQAMSTIDYMSDISVAMINAASSDKERKQAQRHAEQMALEAYQRDVEFWERQQEYNSPEEKRKRLEAAGISPWTEYGQMNTEAPMIKSPIAETLPPLPGLQIPQSNMFEKYMQIKGMINQTKLLEQTLQKTAAETRMKDLESTMVEFYINNKMEEDLKFDIQEQNQARTRWQQLNSEYELTQQQLRNDIEKYNYEKGRRGYDEKYKNSLLDELNLKIQTQAENLKIYRQELENLKQEYNIKEQDIEKNKIYIEDKKSELELNKVEREREKEHIERGGDPNDPWFIRKFTSFSNMIKEATEPAKTVKYNKNEQRWYYWNEKTGRWIPKTPITPGTIYKSNQFEGGEN